MDLSNLHGAAGSAHSDNFRRGRGHGSGMVRPQVKDIKDRKLVLVLLDQVSKVVRCHYTEDCQREVSMQKL